MPRPRGAAGGFCPEPPVVRELCNCIVKMALALAAGMTAGVVFFGQAWAFIERPLCRTVINGHSGCQLPVSVAEQEPEIRGHPVLAPSPLGIRQVIALPTARELSGSAVSPFTRCRDPIPSGAVPVRRITRIR